MSANFSAGLAAVQMMALSASRRQVGYYYVGSDEPEPEPKLKTITLDDLGRPPILNVLGQDRIWASRGHFSVATKRARRKALREGYDGIKVLVDDSRLFDPAIAANADETVLVTGD